MDEKRSVDQSPNVPVEAERNVAVGAEGEGNGAKVSPDFTVHVSENSIGGSENVQRNSFVLSSPSQITINCSNVGAFGVKEMVFLPEELITPEWGDRKTLELTTQFSGAGQSAPFVFEDAYPKDESALRDLHSSLFLHYHKILLQ